MSETRNTWVTVMINIDRQIAHWRKGAEEDWEVAQELVSRRRIRHGLCFAHLSLEKILKAHVCRNINDIAPPVHNLTRLATLSGLTVDEELRNLLAEVSPFNIIEVRYPDMLIPEPSFEEAKAYMQKIDKAFTWLTAQFKE